MQASTLLYNIVLLLATCPCLIVSYTLNSASRIETRLGLFDIFKGGSKAKESDVQKSKLPVQLEKISNTQNRDWKKEEEAALKNKKPAAVRDKQPFAYNFKKPNEFPNLYKGWIKADGDQIAKQMISATKSCLSKKEMLIEVLFDPVPNLDEVAFGTVFNQKHVSNHFFKIF